MQCPDMSMLIGMSAVSDSSRTAVNSLIGFNEYGNSLIVCQYAMDVLLNKMKADKAITFAKRITTDNPNFQGLVG